MSTTTQTADDVTTRSETENRYSDHRIFRRLVLVAGPSLAAIAMWLHPHTGEDVYESLSPVADTFVLTHGLLSTALALVAVGMTLLVRGAEGPVATLARLATGVFAFCYIGYVAVVGLAKGLMIREAQSLPADQQAGVAEVVGAIHADQALFAVGVVGALAYLVAILAVGLVRYRSGAHPLAVGLLAPSAIAIATHHGLLAVAGMASFLVAALWLNRDR